MTADIEYQSRSSTVNVNATPRVQYAYTEMSGGANHSRLTSMTYPDGYAVNDNYSSGLNDTISRLSSPLDRNKKSSDTNCSRSMAMRYTVVVSLAAGCCMSANSGCTTSIPNDSAVETIATPLVVLDSAKDANRAPAAAQDEIELDYDSTMQIALELVNGLQEPISVRCTESADRSILNLEVELYRNGERLMPRLKSKPPHIDLFKPRRLAHNESVMSTILLKPEYKDDDLTAGRYEVVLRYQASPGNAIGLTPLDLEKRVKLRISRNSNHARAPRSSSSRRD